MASNNCAAVSEVDRVISHHMPIAAKVERSVLLLSGHGFQPSRQSLELIEVATTSAQPKRFNSGLGLHCAADEMRLVVTSGSRSGDHMATRAQSSATPGADFGLRMHRPLS